VQDPPVSDIHGFLKGDTMLPSSCEWQGENVLDTAASKMMAFFN
jgi:hypothetical protein